MIERCKDCIHYTVVAQGKKDMEKAVCPYRVSMIRQYTKACKKHYEKKER